MKRVHLDKKSKQIKEFVQSLPLDKNGCILDLNGKALLRVLPACDVPVDRAKLRAAILKRRDESRRLNQDWQYVDREMWDSLPPT